MIEYALSFVAVAKSGGFSAAAKNTGISKASLSRHVSELEVILGIPLLHRTTRSLSLTEAGKKFFDSCENIEEHYQEAVNHITDNFKGMQGRLKITAPIDFGIQFLPGIIESFIKKYPHMDITLSFSNMNETISDGNYDLAIRIANQLPDSNLKMNTLFSFKRLICASPEYLKTHQPPTSLNDLKQHRCITSLNRNPSIIKPQWQFSAHKKQVNFPLNHFIEIDSLFAQRELILRGVGIGRLPDYFIKNELKTGKLIEVLKNIEKPNSYVYLLYPNSLAIPKKTRTFIDFMKENF